MSKRLDGIGLAVGGAAAAAVSGVVYLTLRNPFFNDIPQLAGTFFVLGALMALKRPALTAFLALCGVAWAGSGLVHPRGTTSLKVAVLGVDGATFQVIDRHPEALPNFTKLKSEGTRAVLTSIEPMFSPLLWTTIASGRRADEHGIRGFRVQSKDCKVARFWDIAENAGMGVGLYKWLVDYPPAR